MTWFISHDSALEYWRNSFLEGDYSARYTDAGFALYTTRRSGQLPDKPEDLRSVQFANQWGLKNPLHVLVSSTSNRKYLEYLQCHVVSHALPSNSFARLDDNLAVSAPELCFLQMAGQLSLLELIELGYELCGRYRMVPDVYTGQGFSKAYALTSVDKLRRYLAKTGGFAGCKRALQALRHILDGAWSPMETNLAMQLVLPHKLGGYALPKPQLNYTVKVASHLKKSIGKEYFVCDLFWPSRQLAVEYDSEAYHSGAQQLDATTRRINSLSFMGIYTVSVSKWQLNNVVEFRKVAQQLSSLLGKRLRCPQPAFTRAHATLRKHLLPKLTAW